MKASQIVSKLSNFNLQQRIPQVTNQKTYICTHKVIVKKNRTEDTTIVLARNLAVLLDSLSYLHVQIRANAQTIARLCR